jgi:lipid II:glycine glycyltransferase (peptidoglycan interpeptide bridge formation enzyme)
MEINEIKEKEKWENFLLECRDKTFLDSWNWGEFQKMMGNNIWRLGAYEENNLLSVALVIKIAARRGTFLFCPHGPIIKKQETQNKRQILGELLSELKKIAKEEKASFIRIAPIWPVRRSLGEGGEKNEENIRIFKELGFRQAPIHMHPELTWELDITPDEERLLMQMRKTTRYLIRQAQKNKDIEISQSQKLENVEIFNKLYQETVDRHHFIPFSLSYLKNEFLSFAPDNQSVQRNQGCPECTEGQIATFIGKYKGEIISSAMIIFWQGIAFYHQGASSSKYSKIPVSYLLQWEAIREAKKRGCNIYNFWGIAPGNDPSHPWTGLTLFKMGFGGYKKEYVKTQDFIISNKYWLNYLVEKIRKSKRGL